MVARRRGRFWGTCRIYFRRFRIAVWLAILALLGALIYVNQVGLPDFAKRALLDNLRARGLDLQFSRLRLDWHFGIIAENVHFGQPHTPLSSELTAAQVRLKLSHSALARLRFQVDGLVLRHGRLIWALTETNQAPRQLVVEEIQSDLRFLPGDEWSLDQFTARFAGANIQLSGTVAHASAVQEWKFFKAGKAAPAGMWRDRFRALSDLLECTRFSVPPKLRLDVRGDARDLTTFAVRMLLSAPSADTPWGTLSRGWFGARLFPAGSNGMSNAHVTLEAGEAQTRWATARNLQLNAELASFESLTNLGNANLRLSAERVRGKWGRAMNLQAAIHGAAVPGQTNQVNAELQLRAEQVSTKWGSATNAQLEAAWTLDCGASGPLSLSSATNAQLEAAWSHSLTHALPLRGEGTLRCSQAQSDWATARELRLSLRLAAPQPDAARRGDASWAWWAPLAPYAVDWDGEASGLQSHGVEARRVACAGSWHAPALTITNLQAELDRHRLDVHGHLDVATRNLHLDFKSDIDPHAIAPLLQEPAQRYLAECSWAQPPQLQAQASAVLPPWTNRPPDWFARMQPTIDLHGRFKIEHGAAYCGVSLSSAQSHFSWSNLVLRLPDLTVTRPEGRLEAVHELDGRTKDFYLRVSSTLDLSALRPVLNRSAQEGLDYFTFTQPPAISAEAWGRLHAPEQTGIRGQVALTNFTFRNIPFSGVQTSLQYTNRFLHFVAPRVQRGAQQATADGLGADFAAQLIYLTNGFSTTDPMVIASAIGAHVARAVEPYRFEQPPRAHVQGTIPMHGEDAADLHFDLDGGPFQWWRLRVPYIAGHIHWLGQHLSLRNVLAAFYGGEALGDADFDFHPRDHTDYRFNVTMTGALLRPLTEDLFLTTNRLDGRVTGTLIVSRASTAGIRSWEGQGEVALRDGFIWEVPIFGLFSDLLNKVKPGLGSSRASAGACTFVVTNGVIHSDDLEIRSTGMRLDYRGTLDFDGQVNAYVEAQVLRDTWLVGPFVSTVLWPVTKLFEYTVTGSLNNPKAEPRNFLPKVILLPFQMPFHPLRSLRGLLPEDVGVNRTNGPPLLSPKQQ